MKGNTFIFFNLELNSILDNVPFNSLHPDDFERIPKVKRNKIPLLSIVNLWILPPFLIQISWNKMYISCNLLGLSKSFLFILSRNNTMVIPLISLSHFSSKIFL